MTVSYDESYKCICIVLSIAQKKGPYKKGIGKSGLVRVKRLTRDLIVL